MVVIYFIYKENQKFLKVETKGCLNKQELLKISEEMHHFADDIRPLNVLLDISDSNLNICIHELKAINGFVRQIKNEGGLTRIANLVFSSKETAFAYLFREEAESIQNLDFEVFSIHVAALNWLNLN